jgi:hypothetical protein
MGIILDVLSFNETRKAQKAQRQAQSEQRAGNAGEAAAERRRQIREERIRRGQLMQSAEGTGTSGSSGEVGALGNLATTLSSNMGFNLGKLQTAQNISIFQQQASDALNRAAAYQKISDLDQKIGSAILGGKK